MDNCSVLPCPFTDDFRRADLAAYRSLSALTLMVAIAALGCDSRRAGFVPVSGKVTIDGTPVTTGRIEFFPESGRPSSGVIDSEGRYELKTYDPGDGAKPGSYVVTITAKQDSEEAPEYNSIEDEMNGVLADTGSRASRQRSQGTKWLVPQKYANRSTSGLTAEVGGEEGIDFAITSGR